MRLAVRFLRLVPFLTALAVPAAQANEFPSRPVSIVVPFVAGGPTDLAARTIAEALRRPLGQSVVIENRGGAGGIAGTEAVIHGARDGYTMLLGAPGPLVITPSVRSLRYDVTKDLVPLAEIWRSAQVFVVNPKLGLKSVAELVAYAKANPGKINVGSAGLGTLPHLSLELLKREARIDLTHVPYRGTAAAIPNLLGGQIDALFGDVAVLAATALAGKLTALAVTSSARSPLLPDVPTMVEAGVPALVAESWYGLLVPVGVPEPVRARLDAAVQAALADPEYRTTASRQGGTPVATSSETFGLQLQSETAKWGPVARASGVSIQ